MAQRIVGRQAIDEGEHALGDGLGYAQAGRLQHGFHVGAHRQRLGRRGRRVNRPAEGGQDRAGLPRRSGAGLQLLHQGGAVEARQDDAQTPVDADLVQHLRRRAAGGEHGAGEVRLVARDPARNLGLEQLDDLAGRPGVDVRESALADLLSQASLHVLPPRPLYHGLVLAAGSPPRVEERLDGRSATA